MLQKSNKVAQIAVDWSWLNNQKQLEKDSGLNNMERKSNYGGARAGAGRPKGSGNKITAQDLLDAAHKVSGKPFVVNLMEGYQQSIDERNNKVRVMYEKMILDKVIADRQQIEITESDDAIQAKRLAFAEALAKFTTLGNTNEKS